MKYFSGRKTREEIRARFVQLAKVLYPDNGGNAEEFKAMMQEYQTAYNAASEAKTESGKERTINYDSFKFANIINSIITFDGIKIEIIGSWIWVSGNSFAYHEQLKALHFWWSKSKKAWYFNGEDKFSYRRGSYSMKQLRQNWTVTEIETIRREALEKGENA